jgi:hypothetical protein
LTSACSSSPTCRRYETTTTLAPLDL